MSSYMNKHDSTFYLTLQSREKLESISAKKMNFFIASINLHTNITRYDDYYEFLKFNTVI